MGWPGPRHAVRRFRPVPVGNALPANQDTTDMPLRGGMSRSWATPSPTGQLSGKRVDDRQPIDPPAGLKVLSQWQVAPNPRGRREHQRIVEIRSTGWCRETPSPGVRFLAVESGHFRHRPCAGAHSLDGASPLIFPRDHHAPGVGGDDFQLVTGPKTELLNHRLG